MNQEELVNEIIEAIRNKLIKSVSTIINAQQEKVKALLVIQHKRIILTERRLDKLEFQVYNK